MKLKLTLRSSGLSSVGEGSRDLVATMDSSTTIGDLATYLVRADPQPCAVGGAGDLTLTVVDQRDQLDRAVDPRSTVPESGLRSGVTVAVTRCSASFVDAGPAVAVVAIVAGPDSGKEFPLRRGTAYIGRGHGCEVQVSDSSVSRRHAKLLVADGAEVVDLGSANGVSIGGADVARTALTAGDRLRLGDTELEVRLLGAAAGASAADSASAAFVRSPRIAPTFEGSEFELPELPERPKPSRPPWLAMMVPALMGMGLFAFTRSPYSLMFVLMSPMMMLGNHVEQRRGGTKEFARQIRDFREDLGVLATRIRESLQVEADLRRGEHPSSTDCAEACRAFSPLLWTRRGDMAGFLQLRLGQGTLPSRSSMKMPAVGRSKAEAWVELATSIEGLSVVSDVPVVVDPLTTGAIGVSGLRSVALPVARSLVLQAVSLHSPAELIVAAFASASSAPDWDWLKWVPHTTSPHSPISATHLTSTAPACSELLSELEDLVAPAGEPNIDQARPRPRVLVLVENDAPVERSRLVQLAERGWDQGICVVWLAPETILLPAACRVFIEVTGREGSVGHVGYVNEGKLITPVAVDAISLEQTLAAARCLAPLEDSGTPVDDDSDLPRAVSLLTLTGTDLARSPQAVIERWGESRSIVTGPFAPAAPHRKPGNLRAIVGQSAQGTFSLDLRSDGPHALVGGTTGAGKSELLQAWILGMAAAHSPQRVTFLLVDYKGGSAFRDCVELPHTVGLVTDLSPHLVRRALASLSAELRYREHLLARHRVKDLAELERRGEVDVPPSLVIVVDEFAALVQEVPGFVEGVVNVAQRGRSLGLHLILATQRPAGVIKDNLRANTNLRLALRVADENDSSDVLGSTVAAYFDPAVPGRAVSKSGPRGLTPFQAGYAGGWTTDTPPPPEMRVEMLGYGAGRLWEPPVVEAELDHEDLGPTDIQRLVATIGLAAGAAELPSPRVPWLPELCSVYDLARMITDGRDDTLAFGVADDPDNQAQPVVAFNPDKEGNLAVFGASGSGKSVLLRTIALAAGLTVRGGPCHVYGIDFGNHALSMLESLPHVGSIVSGADHERLTRLLTFLRETIDERAVRYSRASAATITDYRRIADAPDEPRIVVLVDGLMAFRQAYETGSKARWLDLFTSLAADGRPAGVHFVISVDQRTGMPSSLASAVQRRVVLRMAHPDDYAFLGVAGDVLGMSSSPGRGLLNNAEIQCAVLGGTSEVATQSRAVSAFGDALREAGVSDAPPIGSLTERVLMETLPCEVDGRPVLGVGSTRLSPLTFEVRGSFVVTGPSGSGRTTSLASLARSLQRWNAAVTLYLVTPKVSSELAALSDWAEVAAGADAVIALAIRLQAELREGRHQGPIAVVIERVDDLAGTSAESSLLDLAKACIDNDQFVVAEGETTFFGSSFGLPGLLKTSRSGLALQPDGIEGQVVFRSGFPSFTRADIPQGRGFLVERGRPEMLQVAMSA
ncbi:MAG TPA: FtsK/SpoIIIE domain-containing protein [Dermatophilaceae bacterium]|nr:FtsK/SpoIIIE domain-containing protein [Dermatophilaceae bacterium]